MDTIKDRSGMDIIEAEDIKKWQEYTEELFIKDLHDQDNHNGVITHLEPDIIHETSVFSPKSLYMRMISLTSSHFV